MSPDLGATIASMQKHHQMAVAQGIPTGIPHAASTFPGPSIERDGVSSVPAMHGRNSGLQAVNHRPGTHTGTIGGPLPSPTASAAAAARAAGNLSPVPCRQPMIPAIARNAPNAPADASPVAFGQHAMPPAVMSARRPSPDVKVQPPGPGAQPAPIVNAPGGVVTRLQSAPDGIGRVIQQSGPANVDIMVRDNIPKGTPTTGRRGPLVEL